MSIRYPFALLRVRQSLRLVLGSQQFLGPHISTILPDAATTVQHFSGKKFKLSPETRSLMSINHASIFLDRYYIPEFDPLCANLVTSDHIVALCPCSCAYRVELVIMRLALETSFSLFFLYVSFFQSIFLFENPCFAPI